MTYFVPMTMAQPGEFERLPSCDSMSSYEDLSVKEKTYTNTEAFCRTTYEKIHFNYRTYHSYISSLAHIIKLIAWDNPGNSQGNNPLQTKTSRDFWIL